MGKTLAVGYQVGPQDYILKYVRLTYIYIYTCVRTSWESSPSIQRPSWSLRLQPCRWWLLHVRLFWRRLRFGSESKDSAAGVSQSLSQGLILPSCADALARFPWVLPLLLFLPFSVSLFFFAPDLALALAVAFGLGLAEGFALGTTVFAFLRSFLHCLKETWCYSEIGHKFWSHWTCDAWYICIYIHMALMCRLDTESLFPRKWSLHTLACRINGPHSLWSWIKMTRNGFLIVCFSSSISFSNRRYLCHTNDWGSCHGIIYIESWRPTKNHIKI